jgi:ABC-2 type transport system permease protein
MFSIIGRTLKDRRIILLIYCLASIGLLWMYIGLFPYFRDQAASMEKLLAAYPESLMKAFNFDIKSFITIEGYLSSEQFSFVWPIMTIFMLIGYAGSSLAGEVEKGTIEILLSQPISRTKLFLSRYFGGLLIFIIFLSITILVVPPLCKIYDIELNMDNLLRLALLAGLFGWSIYSIGMFFSSMFNDRAKVYFLSGLIVVGMYVVNLVASLRESLSDLKYASFFYYYNPLKAFVYSNIDQWAYLIFGGTILITFILGLIIFAKRDITT